jgi:hypothetical protein
MRRLVAGVAVAAVCGTVFSLGILLGRPGAPLSPAVEPVVPDWMRIVPRAALAEEAMQFRPVPPESAATLERPRAARVAPAPASPAALPPAPASPGAPAPPAPPELPTDESGDVVRFGSNILIRKGQVVSGDVVAMGGDVTVNGHVEKDVVAMGGDVYLGPEGQVDGQVVTIGGKLHEQPGSHVGGPRVTAERWPRRWRGSPFPPVVGSGIKAMWSVAKMMLALLIAWGITQLAPQRTRTAVDAFKREPVKSLGFGLLAAALFIPSVVALALVVVILCITIIGIPLALAVILGYVLAIILLCMWGSVIGATVLGERLSRQMGRPAATLTLMAVWGIVALTVVKVVGHLFGGIPMGGFAGGVLVFLSNVTGGVLTCIGAGALLWTQLTRDSISQWWPGRRASAASNVAAPFPVVTPPASPMPVPEAPPAPPPIPGS